MDLSRMTILRGMVWVAAATLLMPHASGGQNSSNWFRMKPIRPEVYECRQSQTPVVIDGRLDDRAWRNAPWTKAFRDIEGDAKPRPRFHTRAKMLWDDQYFYVAAKFEEPHLSATLTQRDAVIFQDNDFEIFMDPDRDSHEYYELEINALNTVWDLFLGKPYINGGPAVNEWNIEGLKTAVHLRGTLNNASDRDEGWSVEFAIPWKALGQYAHRPAPPRLGDVWRVNFSRVEWRFDIVDGKYRKVPGTKEDNWVWSPQGIIDMHRPEKWGQVIFAGPRGGAARPDAREMELRNLLQEIYYLQRDYEGTHKVYADSFEALGIPAKTVARNRLLLRQTTEGYTASGGLRGGPERWQIRQDAKVTREVQN